MWVGGASDGSNSSSYRQCSKENGRAFPSKVPFGWSTLGEVIALPLKH
jgi:hypothetical protein